MQCGCPVIASNVTFLLAVVGDAAILIDPTDDEAMVAAYEKVYYDEKLQKEWSQKGLKRAKNFSWKACIDAMVQEFKKHDFTEQKSSYIVSAPRPWKYLFQKFIFGISNEPEKTRVALFCFGIPIFRKNCNHIGK
jgi:hypothetical protein